MRRDDLDRALVISDSPLGIAGGWPDEPNRNVPTQDFAVLSLDLVVVAKNLKIPRCRRAPRSGVFAEATAHGKKEAGRCDCREDRCAAHGDFSLKDLASGIYVHDLIGQGFVAESDRPSTP